MQGRITRLTLIGAAIAVAAFSTNTGVLAQSPTPVHFSGVINDYTPATVPPSTTRTGPWEIRGNWSLDLNGTSGLGNFSAALTMERPDYAITESLVNVDAPMTRKPHTHDIILDNAVVTTISGSGGIEVSGPVTISGNGGEPPDFPSSCSTCTLTVDITGGTIVEFSNITLKFGGPPSTHFGTQPIHGVVRKAQ